MIPVRGRADKGTIAPSRADDRGTWCALSAMRTVPPPKTISLKESEKDRRRIGAGCTLIIGKLSICDSALADFRK